jgi:ABC-type branched-subunit amino acid transport system substrate-binding protein
VVLEMAYALDRDDYELQLERLKAAEVEVIVHWGDARESAVILNQMRSMNMQHPYFASDRTISDEFVALAGANAEGVISTSPWNPSRRDAQLDAFRAAFRERFGEEPETYAAHAYDGMNMLIWATQVAGLNRAKIRDLLAHQTKPWPGVTGDIPLSAALDDAGKVFLARFENGSWKYLSRNDLEIPSDKIPASKHIGGNTASLAGE